MGLILSASSSCQPFLYQIQSDAGMSGVLVLFDYLSASLSIRGRQGKSYHYLNPLSLKISPGGGGETFTGDWFNTTAQMCYKYTERHKRTNTWLTTLNIHNNSEQVELRPERYEADLLPYGSDTVNRKVLTKADWSVTSHPPSST